MVLSFKGEGGKIIASGSASPNDMESFGSLTPKLFNGSAMAIVRSDYKTGKMVGMKPAGGISKSKLALHYLVMVKEVMGEDWLNNEWFRFGASSLANDVLMQIVKEKTGLYQSANYFSVD